jgi:hypothetical protein
MIRFASTQGCRNNHINNRKLVSRNPIRRLIVAIWIATLIPLSAYAIDIETPAVGLTDVPLEYVASGVPAGSVAQLTVIGQTWSATADSDGNAAFDDVVLPEVGVVIVTATAAGESVSKNLRYET